MWYESAACALHCPGRYGYWSAISVTLQPESRSRAALAHVDPACARACASKIRRERSVLRRLPNDTKSRRLGGGAWLGLIWEC